MRGGYGTVSLDTGHQVIFAPSVPAWLRQPYATSDACWGCGCAPDDIEDIEVTVAEQMWTEGVGVQTLEFRSPARLCRWCAELKDAITRS